MSDFLNKIKKNSMIGCLLCIAFGIVICIWPGTVLLTLCRVAGAVILAFGVISILTGLKAESNLVRSFQAIVGIILAILGIWILTNPGTFIRLIPVILGIIMLYHGIKNIYSAIEVKRGKDKKWWIGLILGVITAIIGVLLIRCAFLALEVGMIYLGIGLIYDGVSGLWLVFRVQKAAKNAKAERDALDVEYQEVE